MMRTLIAALATVLLLAACHSEDKSTGRVTGSLQFSDQAALSSTAAATITLQDVSLADAPAVVVAQKQITDPGPSPIDYQLVYDLSVIDELRTYSVRAQIHDRGQLLFTSDTHAPVLTLGAGPRADLALVEVRRLPTVSPRLVQPGQESAPERTGMFRYMADAALFRDCSSNLVFPVAMEGAYIELERAYLNSGIEPGSEVYTRLRGRYLERPPMEGNINEVNLIVDSFESISSEKQCGPMNNASLINTYWKLVEVNGRAVTTPQDQHEAHMVLATGDEAPRVHGHAGCNRFFGGFEASGNSITFGRMGATMMACPDGMETEQAFLAALEATDRFAITGQTLALYSGETRAAYFEAVYLR
jgi:uncharacterized lipoprotein YbaY/heat shock protein HslJ